MANTSPQTLFKLCLISLVLQFIIWFSRADTTSLRNTNRELTESVNTYKRVNCSYVDSKCVCPYTCYEQMESENFCVAKKCYSYDSSLGQCKREGRNAIGPIVLQAIPFTGVFGSGFGNIGRWDLFAAYMSLTLGGCCFIMISASCFLCLCPAGSDDTKETAIMCWGKCSTCLWALGVLGFYVAGIVMISDPGVVVDGDGCPLIY